MLAAIRAAQSTITFETYIYGSGRVGREFVDALNARARAGVKVHVLRDWVGSLKMDEALFEEMRSAGIEVERFHEPSGINWNKLNNRTHRKLLVVDGRIGFTSRAWWLMASRCVSFRTSITGRSDSTTKPISTC